MKISHFGFKISILISCQINKGNNQNDMHFAVKTEN